MHSQSHPPSSLSSASSPPSLSSIRYAIPGIAATATLVDLPKEDRHNKVLKGTDATESSLTDPAELGRSGNGMGTCRTALKVGLGILKKVGGSSEDRDQTMGTKRKPSGGRGNDLDQDNEKRDSGTFASDSAEPLSRPNTSTFAHLGGDNIPSLSRISITPPPRASSTPPMRNRSSNAEDESTPASSVRQGSNSEAPPSVPEQSRGWEMMNSKRQEEMIQSEFLTPSEGEVPIHITPSFNSNSGSSPKQGGKSIEKPKFYIPYQPSQYSLDSESQSSRAKCHDAYLRDKEVEDPTFGVQPGNTPENQEMNHPYWSNRYYGCPLSPGSGAAEPFAEQYHSPYHSGDSYPYFAPPLMSPGTSAFPPTPLTSTYYSRYFYDPRYITESPCVSPITYPFAGARMDVCEDGFRNEANAWWTGDHAQPTNGSYATATPYPAGYPETSSDQYTAYPYQYQYPWGYYYYYRYTTEDGHQVDYPMYYDPVLAARATGQPPYQASEPTTYYHVTKIQTEPKASTAYNHHDSPSTVPFLHRACSSFDIGTPHRPAQRLTSMENVRSGHSRNRRAATQKQSFGRLDAERQTYAKQPNMDVPGPTGTQTPMPWPKDVLLKELHVDRKKEWPLTELTGHIMYFALDPLGCYALVRSFEVATPDEQLDALDEILPSTMEVSMDAIGYRCMQRLFNVLSDECRGLLIGRMLGKCINLSMDVNGYRVLVAALMRCTADQARAIFDDLCKDLLACLHDNWAHIVLIKAMECVPSKTNQIISLVLPDLLEIAINAHGTHLLQRCFACLEYEKTKPVYDLIITHAHFLAWNGHGNFVVQYIFDHAPMAEKVELYNALKGQFFDLSQQKFASHVVERALERCDYYTKSLIVDELSGGEDMTRGYGTLRTLIIDDYANYIVQSMLKNMKPPKLGTLIAKLQWVLSSFMVDERFVGGPKYLGCVHRVLNERLHADHGVKLTLPPVPRKVGRTASSQSLHIASYPYPQIINDDSGEPTQTHSIEAQIAARLSAGKPGVDVPPRDLGSDVDSDDEDDGDEGKEDHQVEEKIEDSDARNDDDVVIVL